MRVVISLSSIVFKFSKLPHGQIVFFFASAQKCLVELRRTKSDCFMVIRLSTLHIADVCIYVAYFNSICLDA